MAEIGLNIALYTVGGIILVLILVLIFTRDRG
jgi:hypothetical protein